MKLLERKKNGDFNLLSEFKALPGNWSTCLRMKIAICTKTFTWLRSVKHLTAPGVLRGKEKVGIPQWDMMMPSWGPGVPGRCSQLGKAGQPKTSLTGPWSWQQSPAQKMHKPLKAAATPRG